MNDLAPARAIDFKAEAHRDPRSIPLDEIDVSNPYLYSEDTWDASSHVCGATTRSTSSTVHSMARIGR
jgi:hypothetical protein